MKDDSSQNNDTNTNHSLKWSNIRDVPYLKGLEAKQFPNVKQNA